MFDDAFAEGEPALVGLGFVVGSFGGEDIRGTEVRAEGFGDDGPTHEFGDGEEAEELLFLRDEGVAGVGVDAVQEVGLFVVVRGKEDVIDDSLEDLETGC